MNHFKLSILKSIFRISGSIAAVIVFIVGFILWNADITAVSALVIAISYGVAEVLGILEEKFDKRKEE